MNLGCRSSGSLSAPILNGHVLRFELRLEREGLDAALHLEAACVGCGRRCLFPALRYPAGEELRRAYATPCERPMPLAGDPT